MKKILSVFLVMVMIMAGAAYAQEASGASVSADGWTAKAADGKIRIVNGDGAELALLEYEKDETVQDLLVAADYNFDGMSDLAALIQMGTANAYYTVWLRTADGGFEAAPEFETLCSPSVNAERARITTLERVNAGEYYEGAYGWIDGELTLLRMRRTVYEEDGTVSVTDQMQNGESVVERDYHESSEQWEKIREREIKADALIGKIVDGPDCRLFITYEAMTEMDGEAYYVYFGVKGDDPVCVMYISAADEATILLDDNMDGVALPEWRLDDTGEKTAISH